LTFNANQLPSTPSNRKRPDPLEAGSYPARLVQAIIIGIQAQRPYKGETKAPCLMMRLTYEMLDEFLKDDEGNDLTDKPRWLSEEIPFFSLKADLAKSTKRYYALDPNSEAGGDWSKLIAAPCVVTVVVQEGSGNSAGKLFEKISNVSAMRPKEAAKAPALVNPPVLWDFYSPDVDVFNTFPDWIQEKIKSAVDFPGSALERALGGASKPKPAPANKLVDEAVDPLDAGPDEEENW